MPSSKLLKQDFGLVLLLCHRVLVAASCRVAVCFSGHLRSFVYPVVHRSIRRNLIDAIEADGCQVDIFAYATLQDTVGRSKQAFNVEHTPETVDVETSMEFLAPTRLIWHHEQAGLIPKSCTGEKIETNTAKSASVHEDEGGFHQHWKMYEEEYSERFYWQLYKSKAAYRMALREELQGGFLYDWIVRARFDLAWLRPLAPLNAFSAQVVWVADNVWPMSDDFALVPRAFSERFFSAISAFYACDGSSWPPPTSWWQPNCFGREFEACTLFRYLHASEIPHRTYPMFGYVLARSGQGTSGDCAAALGEWAARRCQALTSAGRMADSQRGEVIVDPEPRAWETLVGTTALGTGEGTPSTDELERLRSNLIRLRDAVALPPSMLDGENLKDLEWTPRVERVRELPNVWRVDSPFNCDIDKYPGRAPQLVKYYTGGASLVREIGLAIKCLSRRLTGSSDAGGDLDSTSCVHARPLELVMIDVSLHWKELGICTSDGSLEMSAHEQIAQFFSVPAAHCVGYGRLVDDKP